MTNCLFCRIVAGEIPCNKVAENQNFLAFMDINPVSKGHVLIIPKEHSENLLDMDVDKHSSFLKFTKAVAQATMSGVNSDGFNLIMNNGRVAGQEVPHLHFHIIPRRQGDALFGWPRPDSPSKDELEDTLDSIKSCLDNDGPFRS